MNNLEKIANYELLYQPKYQFVEAFEISQVISDSNLSFDIKLVLGDLERNSNCKLHLTFNGVQNLQLQSGPLPFVLVLLEIYNITNNQWESIHYKVVETEELRLSFFCDDFSVFIVNQ